VHGAPQRQTVITAPPTVTLTATPTPNGTPSAVPFSFTLRSVKVAYGSANPVNAAGHGSLKLLKVGQTVKLLAIVAYDGITTTMPIRLAFRVSRAGTSTFFKSETGTISPADNGGFDAYWMMYRATGAGAYTATGTLYIAGHHQHESATFSVR
jgi:hypothetical protein